MKNFICNLIIAIVRNLLLLYKHITDEHFFSGDDSHSGYANDGWDWFNIKEDNEYTLSTDIEDYVIYRVADEYHVEVKDHDMKFWFDRNIMTPEEAKTRVEDIIKKHAINLLLRKVQ